VPVNKLVRIRFINSGSYGECPASWIHPLHGVGLLTLSTAMYRMSIDSHAFDVVEIDDDAICGPMGIHEVQIGVGQRTSIVVNTNQGQAGDGFWMQANTVVGTCA